MKKSIYNCPLRMWCDVAVISVPMFAIGMAGDKTWAKWISIAILVIGLIGVGISLYHLIKEKPLRDTPLSKDISMAATYVWPCVLSGLIADHFGNYGLPFYILAGVVMGVILLVNHNELI